MLLPCLPASKFHSGCFRGPYWVTLERTTWGPLHFTPWPQVCGGRRSKEWPWQRGCSCWPGVLSSHREPAPCWATTVNNCRGAAVCTASAALCGAVALTLGTQGSSTPRGKTPSINGAPDGTRSFLGSSWAIVGPTGTCLYFLSGLLILGVSQGCCHCPKEKEF